MRFKINYHPIDTLRGLFTRKGLSVILGPAQSPVPLRPSFLLIRYTNDGIHNETNETITRGMYKQTLQWHLLPHNPTPRIPHCLTLQVPV